MLFCKWVKSGNSTGHLSDSEKMHRVVWDVSEFRGRKATILVVDEAVDGWGNINVDDFRY